MSQNRNNMKDTSRSQLYKKSPSTQYIREELRRRFRERLTLTRNTQQCRNRSFYSNIVSEVQKLLITSEESEELNAEEMYELLLKVEQEVYKETSQKEAENYESLMEQEINVLLQDTNYVCQICDQPVQFPTKFPNDSRSVICSDCVNLHFNTDKL